jgi:hypothetical protein
MKLRSWFACVGLAATGIAPMACGGVPAENAEYPEIQVRAAVMELSIEEARKEVLQRVVEANKLYQGEQVTFSQPLPEGFEAGVRKRLDGLTGKSGLNVNVVVSVERADLTFRNDIDGDSVRYDVTLSLAVKTEGGTTLQKGKGSSSQEVPTKEATGKEMQRVFLVAALNAFDQYFAEEETLERLNANIDSYLKSHPDEAH